MMNNGLILRFAQEELVYLLRALQIPALLGLEAQPLGRLDGDHQALALAVSDRTLRARGLVQWDSQEERHVDPIIARVLRDCAQPEYTLLVDIFRTDKLNLRYLYTFGKHAVIEHCIPEPGIHQFVVLAAPKDFSEHLLNMLAIEKAVQSSGEAGRSSQEKLDDVHAVTSTNSAEAIRILATELTFEIGNSLASAIPNPKVIRHLALWDGTPGATDNREPRGKLMVIQGDTGIFLMFKEYAGAPNPDLIHGNLPLVREYVKKLLRPVLETLPDIKESKVDK